MKLQNEYRELQKVHNFLHNDQQTIQNNFCITSKKN